MPNACALLSYGAPKLLCELHALDLCHCPHELGELHALEVCPENEVLSCDAL